MAASRPWWKSGWGALGASRAMGLHELQGARKGTWAVKVSGNWRLTFGDVSFEGIDIGVCRISETRGRTAMMP